MSDDKCGICDGNYWTWFEKDDMTYAVPCPDCKPNEHKAYEAGMLDDRYFKSRKEQKEHQAETKQKVAQQEREEWW